MDPIYRVRQFIERPFPLLLVSLLRRSRHILYIKNATSPHNHFRSYKGLYVSVSTKSLAISRYA
jgi:hypothetical protein